MAAPALKSGMFREVTVPVNNSSRWKAITICTGASASTLQDIKVPESCGGFSYRDSGLPGSGVSNRFIYWKTYQDVLELVEESLDQTLSGNMVRYRFQDTPILPQVSIHEIHGHVIILVATVASVHRLVFGHPSKMNKQQTFLLSDQNSSSIFYDASLPDDPKNQFLFTPGGSINSQLVGGASCVCRDGNALFSLATNTGNILLIKMPPLGIEGVIMQQELTCSSVMRKLWNGLIPGAMRGSQPAGESAVSLQMVSIQGEIYLLTVCRDARLRVWSTKTRDCILVDNLLDYTSEEFEENGGTTVANVSGHVIKTIEGGNSSDVCVYLSLQNKARFVFLSPQIENGRLKLEHVTTLEKSPPEDLVDFVVTDDTLMSLWTTQAGDTQVLATHLSQFEDALSTEWESVLLTTSGDFMVVPQHGDPRDVYLDKIFSPGQFAFQDIVKALSVYRRCPAPSVEMESLYSLSSLREEITNAVDAEIRNSASDFELQEEAYIQLQLEQWEKLYSCCLQYKQVGQKAKGLFADPSTGLFAVIKKSTFSVLRPCDLTEELYLSPTVRLPESLIVKSNLSGEGMSAAQFAEDVRLVCDAVQLIESQIPSDVVSMFVGTLETLHTPEYLIERLRELIRADQETTSTLTSLVSGMVNPVFTIETIYNLMEVTDDLDLDMMEGAEGPGHQHYSHLLSGSLGISVLCQSFHQLVSLRFDFIRDLTVLIAFVSRLKEEAGLPQSMKDTIMNELLPKGAYLLRCYKVLVWSSQALSTISPNSVLDFNLRYLSSLAITENSAHTVAHPTSQSTYVAQLFLEGVGGEHLRRRLSCRSEGSSSVWKNDLREFLNTLCLLIWPATDDTIFPEFLVRACQYLRLQEYVYILTPWCTWNEGSRAFFLGLSYLHFDDPHKAVRLFVDASEGVATETFLSQKLLQTEETDHYKLQTLYYLKVIQQLEEHGLPDLVITMATEAINKADPEDPNLPTLLSKVFKHQLELGHNQAAFTAMMNNPDPDRKKDCLRQFLVVLCERGHLSDLVTLDYQDLEDEVVYILETRARSVDLFTHDYYSLLFSHFISREDYRKAGRVMFERGLRLSQEVPGLKSLQKQAQCYLCALNTLRLVKPEYAWIVQPVYKKAQLGRKEGDQEKMEGDKGKISKHDADGKDKEKSTRKLEVLELASLEKDYLLLDARLRLIRNQTDTGLVTGPMPSPEEMLSLLCSAGLYDLAVSITRSFSLSPEPVLSSLALRCVTLAVSTSSHSKISGHDPNTEAWLWLRENSIPPCGAKECTASDQAWSLLKSYLSCLEDGSCVCHKSVASTLLSQNFHLPVWLVHSYKVLDVASLLRVYLTFDLTDQATNLAMEYLEAVTAVLKGTDEATFDLKGLHHPSPMSVWVPYTCIDQLLVALREQDNPTYSTMYQLLKEKLDFYHEKVYKMSSRIGVY